jgi:hypothetical protein
LEDSDYLGCNFKTTETSPVDICKLSLSHQGVTDINLIKDKTIGTKASSFGQFNQGVDVMRPVNEIHRKLQALGRN